MRRLVHCRVLGFECQSNKGPKRVAAGAWPCNGQTKWSARMEGSTGCRNPGAGKHILRVQQWGGRAQAPNACEALGQTRWLAACGLDARSAVQADGANPRARARCPSAQCGYTWRTTSSALMRLSAGRCLKCTTSRYLPATGGPPPLCCAPALPHRTAPWALHSISRALAP